MFNLIFHVGTPYTSCMNIFQTASKHSCLQCSYTSYLMFLHIMPNYVWYTVHGKDLWILICFVLIWLIFKSTK